MQFIDDDGILLYDADKNADLDMNKSRQQNGSDGNDRAASAAPMSQISGVRRLQQSNSVVGIVPKFGVEVPNEQPLAEVMHVIGTREYHWHIWQGTGNMQRHIGKVR